MSFFATEYADFADLIQILLIKDFKSVLKQQNHYFRFSMYKPLIINFYTLKIKLLFTLQV